MVLRLNTMAFGLALVFGSAGTVAADDCQNAIVAVQERFDLLEELGLRETSLNAQARAASDNLSYPLAVNLLDSQVETYRAIIETWGGIAGTARAHEGCWPPRMAARLAVKADGFAADKRQSMRQVLLARAQAREAASVQSRGQLQ
jgi:hypothetical protein